MKLLLFILLVLPSFSFADGDLEPAPEAEPIQLSPVQLPAKVEKRRHFGIGAQIGVQSGLTSEYWTAESRAINTVIGYQHGNLAVSASHLWMFRGAFPGD